MLNQPLSNQGYEVDPETLMPIDLVDKEVKRQQRLQKILEEGNSLVNELSDGRGQLVKEIVALYIERINQLIQDDPECQIFEKLFASIKLKINAGKRIVEGKTSGFIG